VDIILTLKKENPLWGARRIREELRRMRISVSEPTIQKVLKEHGYHPRGGRPRNWERFKSTARDALWAMDFFVDGIHAGHPPLPRATRQGHGCEYGQPVGSSIVPRRAAFSG
jgi:hypothetical protein